MRARDDRELVIQGPRARAEITWHHYTAAGLVGFTILKSPPPELAWTVRANVAIADAFKMSQKPLVFVAHVRNSRGPLKWYWPITAHTITDGRFTARLGPPLAPGVATIGG